MPATQIKISVPIDRVTKLALRQLAAKRETSMSVVVRELIKHGIQVSMDEETTV